jgi:hypothetical protein
MVYRDAGVPVDEGSHGGWSGGTVGSLLLTLAVLPCSAVLTAGCVR